jgi:hypothetical protein
MDETRVSVYHDRASQLASAMDLCHDGIGSYASAVGLLAVHSAISFSDAVLICLTGNKPGGQDHKQTVTTIAKACRKAKVQTEGIKHLAKLVGAKTDIAYGDKAVENERIEILYVSAGRFQAWAERLLKSKGGTHGNDS